VYLPNLQALCSLAEVDADDVAERQDFLRAAGRRFATMTYVNTYADVKALSDTCCTSSNAGAHRGEAGRPRSLVRARPEPRLPGRAQHEADVPAAARAAQVPPREYAEMVEPLIREGERQGPGRQRVRVGGRLSRPPPDDRRRHRAASAATIRRRPVIVHGEVRPELQRAADAVLSTSQMAKYVESHPDRSRYAILTECGLVVRLELEHPEKQFYKPCRLCQYMKATDLESVYRTLRDEPPEQRITVPDDVREGAARAMLRMIELAAA
jgi:quinolinate synthase